MSVGKMGSFTAQSSADKGEFFLAYNLSTIVSLASDNGTQNGYDDSGYYRAHFNPAVAVLILGILSFVFFLACCCTCLCRGSITGDGSRAFRRAMGNNNARTTATRGLARSVIESFPVFSYDLVKGLKAQAKGSECAVCLSDFQDDEMVRLLPNCRHAFHPECIDMWLSSHTTCPVCRTSLLPKDESEFSGIAIAVPDEPAIAENVGVGIDVTDGAAEASSASGEHSLVRVPKESETGRPEWYIATAEGLKPGFHKSCSSVDVDLSERASTSRTPPSLGSKPEACLDDAGSRSGSDRRFNISLNPVSFLRTFSERGASRGGEQGGIEQTDGSGYLRRTVSWLRGRERGESERGSSRHVDPNVMV